MAFYHRHALIEQELRAAHKVKDVAPELSYSIDASSIVIDNEAGMIEANMSLVQADATETIIPTLILRMHFY